MGNNLLEMIESTGIDSVDSDLFLEYEQNLADKIYSRIKKEKGKVKKEIKNENLQARYNNLKIAADRGGVNVENIFDYTETKIYHLVNIMHYPTLNGPDGEKISTYGAKPIRIGSVYRDCYNRAKI